MKKYTGLAVSQGIAMGKIFCYRKQSPEIVKRKSEGIREEKARFREALNMAEQLYAG